MYVSEAVKSSFSCRAFTEKPVSKELIKEILESLNKLHRGQPSAMAYSCNIRKETRSDSFDIESKITEMPMGEKTEYDVYPPNLWDLIEVDALNVAKIYTKA